MCVYLVVFSGVFCCCWWALFSSHPVCVCVSVFIQWVSVSEEEYLPTTQTLFLNEKHTHKTNTHRRTFGEFLTPWDTFESQRIGAPGESERARKERNKNRASFISIWTTWWRLVSAPQVLLAAVACENKDATPPGSRPETPHAAWWSFSSYRYVMRRLITHTHTQKTFPTFRLIFIIFVTSLWLVPPEFFWFSNTHTDTHMGKGSI